MSSIINLKNRPLTTRAVVVEPILKQIHAKEENYTIIATGRSGGGKSAAIIELLSKCDPTFNADRIAFNAAEFIKIIKDQSLKPGSAVLFDEIGESIGARSFMVKQQRDLLIYMQNYRIKRLIVGFTIPHTSFTDIQLRRMAHAYLQFVSKKRVEKRTYWKYKVNQFRDNVYGEPIFTFPVVLQNGKRSRIDRVSFKMPNKKIWDAYIPKKMANIARLEQKMLQTKEVKEAMQTESKDTMVKDFLQVVLADLDKYTHFRAGKTSIISALADDYLSSKYGIGGRKIDVIRLEVESQLKKLKNISTLHTPT